MTRYSLSTWAPLLILPALALSLIFNLNREYLGIFFAFIGFCELINYFFAEQRKGKSLFFFLVTFLAGLLLVLGNIQPILFYPAVASATVAGVFFLSMFTKKSVVQRIAEVSEPNLSPEGIEYCRRVNLFWVLILIGNCIFSFWTAYFASEKIWAVYNGFLSYLIFALLMGLEYLVRQRVKKNHAKG